MTEKEIEDEVEWLLHAIVHPRARCMGRQVTLPSGRRIDLLAVHGPDGQFPAVVTVVEIKANSSKPGDLVQLCEYVWELSKGRYTDIPVRGVLLAPNHCPDVWRLVAMMDGIGLHEFTLTVDVGQRDVDAEIRPLPTARTNSYRPYIRLQGEREIVDEAVGAWARDEKQSREWHPRRRFLSLVPLDQTPVRIAYANGNGRKV